MDLKEAATKTYGLIELQHRAVGVKLVKSKAEYDEFEAIEPVRPMHYCVAVKSAMEGHSIKLTKNTAGCDGGNRALGVVEAPPEFFNGTNGCRMGLYRNETIAANVARAVPIGTPNTYGIVIKPMELFKENPDVVLITAVPRTMMRILQGYTYTFGLPEGMHMSGNQAVCVECTVTPMKSNSINVSMLCAGTRFNAGWKDGEAMIGISFDKYYGTVKGIESTVNPIETDKHKKRIEDNLRTTNNLEIEVEYGKTYYKNKQK